MSIKAKADSFTGTAGNDNIVGTTAADTMTGLTGNDTYTVNNSGDVVVEASGEGTDLVNSTISYTLPAEVENLTLTSVLTTSTATTAVYPAINGTGNGLNNTIRGSAGNNILSGLAGDDTLIGGAGDDLVFGGTGNDVLNESADTSGKNSLNGGAGDDRIYGGALADSISGGTGNDLLLGNSGDDVITGGAGSDAIWGGAGDDTLRLNGTDADTVYLNLNGEFGDGTDTVYQFTRGTDKISLVSLDASFNRGGGFTLPSLDAAALTGADLQTAITNALASQQADGDDRILTFDNGTTLVAKGVGTNLTGSDFVGYVAPTPTVSLSDLVSLETIVRNPTISTSIDDSVTVTSTDSWDGGSLLLDNGGGYSITFNSATAYVTNINGDKYVVVNQGGSEAIIGNIRGSYNSAGADLEIDFNANATTARVETLIESIKITLGNGSDLDPAELTLTLTTGTGSSVSQEIDVLNQAQDPLNITNLNGDLRVVARTFAATNVDVGAAADTNLDDSNVQPVGDAPDADDMAGGTLSFTLGGTTDASDVLSFRPAGPGTSGNGYYRVLGNQLIEDTDGTSVNGIGGETVIGTLTGSGTVGSPLSLTLVDDITKAQIKSLLDNVQFDTNDTTTTIGQRTVTVSLSDESGANAKTVSSSVYVVDTFKTLTTGADTSPAFDGTALTDAYDAPLVGGSMTLNTTDSLDGKAGTDFLLADLTSASVTPTVKDIEQILLTSKGVGAAMDFTSVTTTTAGAANVLLSGNFATTLTNLGAAVGKVDAAGLSQAGTIGFAATNGAVNVLGGTSGDTIDFGTTLNNLDVVDGNTGTDTLLAVINGLTATTGALKIANVENIALTATTSASTVDAAGITGTNVGITMAGPSNAALAVTNIGAGVTQVNNQSGFGLTASFVAAANVAVTGSGAGQVVANFGTTLNNRDHVTGGSATDDTVNADVSGRTQAGTVLSVTTIGLVNGVPLVTVTTNTDHNLLTGDWVSLSGVAATDAANAAIVAALNAGNAFQVTKVSDTVFTLIAGPNAGATQSASSGTVATGDGYLNIDNAELLNFAVNSATVLNFSDFSANNASKLTVTGTGSLTVNDITSANLTTINGSGLSGAQVYDINAAANHSLTGGASTDTFLLTPTATVDNNDTINGNGGSDTLSGTLATAAGRLNISNVENINFIVQVGSTTADFSGVTAGNVGIKGDGVQPVTVNLNDGSTSNVNTDLTITRMDSTVTTLNAGQLDSNQADLTVGQLAVSLTASTVITNISGNSYLVTITDPTLAGKVAVGDTLDFNSTVTVVNPNAGAALSSGLFTVASVAGPVIAFNATSTVNIATSEPIVGGTVDISGFGTAGVTVTASGGVDTLVGGSGGDTFVMGSTLATSDIIDGLSGNDTLNGSISGTITLNVDNVETFNLTATALTNLTTFTSVTGPTASATLNLSGSNQVVLNDLSPVFKTLSTTGFGGAASVDVTFSDSPTRDVAVNFGSGQPDVIRFNLAATQNAGHVTITGFEQPGIQDRIGFQGGSNDASKIQSTNDLVFTNFDSPSIATVGNDSVRITAAGTENVSFQIDLIGLLANQLQSDDFIFQA